MGQAFDNRGFSHTGFADQHRVVFGASLQDLNGPADLVITTNDRVELSRLGALGKINGVFVQGLSGLLGLGRIHALPAPHLVNGALQSRPGNARFGQQLLQRRTAVGHGQQHQLRGQIGIAALLGGLIRPVQQAAGVLGQVHIPGSTADLGQLFQGFVHQRRKGAHVRPCLLQQRTG